MGTRNVLPCHTLLLLALTYNPCGHCLENFTPFPLQNCQDEAIELLFVADAFVDEASVLAEDKEVDNQVKFFSDFLNVFMQREEVQLTRVKVAMATTAPGGGQLLIDFTDHVSREALTANMDNITFTVYEPTQRSDIRDALKFAQSAFSESITMGRISTRVVLMIVNGCDNAIIEDTKLYQKTRLNPWEVRIFVIVICQDDKITDTSNVVVISSVEKLRNNQMLSMAICRKCYGKQWHIYEHELGVSCHQWLTMDTEVHWIGALNECAKENSRLAALETEEEIAHLRRAKQELVPFVCERENGTNECRPENIYIGLSRKNGNIINRFLWSNGRPLLGNHWLPGKPDGGPSLSCGMWHFAYEFLNDSDYSLLSTTNNQPRPSRPGINVSDGYVDIGCGMEETRNALCEVTLIYQNGESQKLFKVMPANTASFNQALDRGEFVVRGSKMASLSNIPIDQQILKSGESPKLFNCGDGPDEEIFIPFSRVCDRVSDCKSSRDETVCNYRTCDSNMEYQCLSTQCIPLEARCDFFKDCSDGSDEENCDTCNGERCCDGTCLPKNRFLDGEIDCSQCLVGPRDEQERELHDEIYDQDHFLYADCLFLCNRTQCISPMQLNDSVVDCAGPEGPIDETIGKLESAYVCTIEINDYLDLVYQQWAPHCVYVADRFGDVIGCRDLAHLLNCANFTCPEGYVKCPDSYCIPLHMLQDKHVDCPMGEDEINMEDYACIGNFACWNSRVCLHPDLVCDGHPHCPMGDDEFQCQVTCAKGFSCMMGAVTVTHFDKSKPLKSLAFIDPRTRYLDLSGVDLSIEFSEEDKARFDHLAELHLSNCQLSNALGRFVSTVEHLETVYSVDLSWNHITEITRNSMLTYMANLRELDLSHNKGLTELVYEGLYPISRHSLLEKLDLSGTNISFINATAFQAMASLRYLNLSWTNIVLYGSHSFLQNLRLVELDLRHAPVEIDNFESGSLTGLSIQSHMYTDNYKLCCPQIRGSLIPEHACLTTQDAISSCWDLIGSKLQRVILWMVGILAIVGNVTVVVYRLFVSKDTTKRAFSLFVTNLSMSDCIMGIYLLIIAVADVYYRGSYVWNESTWRHSTFCNVGGFLSTLSSETSTFFIFLITIDRYVALKYPFGQYNFSKTAMYVCSVACWCAGFVLALVPTLPTFSKWILYSSNGMCLGLLLSTKRLAGWEYSVALFIVLNFVMFIVIACGQYLIYRAMSDNRMNVRDHTRRLQDIAVAKQLSLVALTNFICWFPVGLMGLLALGGTEISPDAYAWSAVLVLPVNSALNPILYTIHTLLAKWERFKAEYFRQK